MQRNINFYFKSAIGFCRQSLHVHLCAQRRKIILDTHTPHLSIMHMCYTHPTNYWIDLLNQSVFL